ncbi:MAG TPA: Cof-type HAD-IIB family hydrolase [Stellaceae bacterium]|nr:Cof-type HAD-IIB family hydrolase [Stellaceae bacterium]
MPRISLLLADVDGTLVTEEKVLTERAQAAVAALRKRGTRFAITSGRPPRGMAMLIEPLRLDSPMAGFNGGVFTRPDLSVIETRTLAPDVTRQVIDIVLHHGMDAWLYTGTDWQIHGEDAPHVAREAWTVKFKPTIVPQFAATDLDQAVKVVGVSDDHALVARCESDVSAALGARASAKRSQPYYLDVTHPEANKGAVVDALVKFLGIPANEVATIGDMPNDVLMFRRSGFSIAMGNASEEVKAQASAVTDSYNNEGFAKAVERYLLEGSAA